MTVNEMFRDVQYMTSTFCRVLAAAIDRRMETSFSCIGVNSGERSARGSRKSESIAWHLSNRFSRSVKRCGS